MRKIHSDVGWCAGQDRSFFPLINSLGSPGFPSTSPQSYCPCCNVVWYHISILIIIMCMPNPPIDLMRRGCEAS